MSDAPSRVSPGSEGAAPDILERLRKQAADVIDWHGQTMKEWDKIRGIVETRKGSDLPRLMFEGLVESLAELMTEGADEIEKQRRNVRHWREECGKLHARSAPAVNGSLPSGESDPSVTMDCAGAGTVAQGPNETYRETVRRVASAREKRMAEMREALERIRNFPHNKTACEQAMSQIATEALIAPALNPQDGETGQ